MMTFDTESLHEIEGLPVKMQAKPLGSKQHPCDWRPTIPVSMIGSRPGRLPRSRPGLYLLI
jgi:hypothetical protein